MSPEHDDSNARELANAGQRPKLASGVVWYHDERRALTVVASHRFKPQRLRLATSFDTELLACCDGQHGVEDLAGELSVSASRIVDALAAWEDQGRGLFRWFAPEESLPAAQRRREDREQAVLDMLRESQAAQEQLSDNVHYHSEQITDALDQFERVETTVSHAFSDEHPALGGRRYGAAFCDALQERGLLSDGARILEIGCGTGRFARSLLDRMEEREPERYASLQYTLLDLSPELRRSQEELCSRHRAHTRHLAANVETHDFGATRFDLIIANEMIADLSVDRARTDRLRAKQAETDGERQVLAYDLSLRNAPPELIVNTGAIRLVERLSGLLSDGGAAVLTEYGADAAFPTAAKLREHVEFSIHFGHLRTVAERLGLGAELHSLGRWLGFDPHFEVLSFNDFRLLFDHLLPFVGAPEPPTRAYSAPMLEAELGPVFGRLGNLDFRPLESWDSLNPFSAFFALVLTR